MPVINRREFITTGVACAVSTGAGRLRVADAPPARVQAGRVGALVRDLFPRLRDEVFLNAAGGTPLGAFAEAGLARYMEFWRLGPGQGRSDYFDGMMAEIRGRFATLIGAGAEEVGLVPCTKAGEQIVLDSLPALRQGGNVVTNDLHFAGCLHNLEGLRRRGLDVRVVRHTDWRVSAEAMANAMDDRTALVAVTLVSNVNGHVEPMRELADLAHARGAIVYADIIQAAGIVPIDVRAMGIDVAACSGYKWLFGPHGSGFLYVAAEHQGTTLPDRLVPGQARHNYPPWTDSPSAGEPLLISPRTDARRYEPGHHSYLGYCALFEGLTFVQEVGVTAMQKHATRLARRLIDRLDRDRYPSMSPHADRSPIVALAVPDAPRLEGALRAARLVVSLSPTHIRVSPAVYNTDADVDRLADVLNAAAP